MNEKVKNLVIKVAKDLNSKILWVEENIGVRVDCADGRSQIVVIVEVEGGKYIRFISLISRFQNLNPIELLKFNMNFTEGAFAIIDWDLKDGLGTAPTLALVTTQRILTADFEEIREKIYNIAVNADSAEKAFTGKDIT